MHGYRDHCIRKVVPFIQSYCPYSMYQLLCPYYGYRQKAEEYPAYYQKRPSNPPPNYIPNLPVLVNSIEPGMISPCVHKYTYLWLKNGESFWAYIVYSSKRAISGWRYKRDRWVQFHLRLRRIKNFTCP